MTRRGRYEAKQTARAAEHRREQAQRAARLSQQLAEACRQRSAGRILMYRIPVDSDWAPRGA